MPSHERESWSSRPAFLLAAIGSAVGFGNIWRFPALAYKSGGGAFFIPYLLALLLVGGPLLLLEIALGQHMQMGDVGVFGSINPRLRGVGLSAVMCGFLVTGYYVPLLAWVLRSLVESFGIMKDGWENVSGEDAEDYFFNDIVGMETLGDDLKPSRMVWTNVAYLLASWVCIGGCVAFGVKWTGRIAYFTMGFPIVLLFLLFGRSITLEGAEEGIHAYIGEWDMSVLTEQPDVWSTAVSQIFFSLGTTFGVMTAFGSHCPEHSPATENSIIIALSNSFFSFIAGFAVFGSLGYLKYYEGADDMADVVTAGPALMFGAYPAVLSTLPGGLHWVRLLFFNLFLLGIDSAFAMTEAVLTVIKDSNIGSTVSDKMVVFTTVGFGCLMGIMYTTDAGLIFLDTVDFYINFIMILIGFCKAFSAGWMYGLQDQKHKFGESVVQVFMFTTFGSVISSCIIWFGVEGDTTIFGFVIFFLMYSVGIKVISVKLRAHDLNPKHTLYDLYMGNVLDLTANLESSVGKIPKAWPFLLKHFIPQVLLALFINLAFAKNGQGQTQFAHYEGYLEW
eukprot:CAMPEP_0204617046 /NCGR_PEP_ID=MMETSP0717-20131115/4133_1 /ASSEMBLY_ACC=CAM_ASM_000666 /TAXON_ID=230516 /ORGANISM="Chaetoceros curvisetus" /LENGTH=560 /DNA_ID=CAMNT_0051630461 /DNA_START=486 /DNA_END=2165 /DNA_ORIENTATION=-